MQQAIAREEKTRKTAEKKVKRETERITDGGCCTLIVLMGQQTRYMDRVT
jgi:hypothetical protein